MPKSLTDRLNEQKKAARERAKAAKKAYLERPEVQKKLLEQKEKLRKITAAKRKKLSELRKSKRLAEKKSLKEAQKLTRDRRQQTKDEVLAQHVSKASSFTGAQDSKKDKPTLTVIHGGLSGQKPKTKP